MKYAVLGSAGQLGRDLCPRLVGEVVLLDRSHLDLLKPDSASALLHEIRPDVFINCAAYNYVDRAEADATTAFNVNAEGLRTLAQACDAVGCLLVHFSSDYVFGMSYDRQLPYLETAAPAPLNVYGLSKLLGEYWVRMLCARHLVIRTCGLYGVWGSGGKGGNFVETMLRLAQLGKPVRVVNDQVCTPSYTVDVASATVALLSEQRTGLFHITNSGSCSWYEFASTIFRLSGHATPVVPITSSEFGARARRPSYSVLNSAQIPPLRPWQEAIAAYLQERQQRLP